MVYLIQTIKANPLKVEAQSHGSVSVCSERGIRDQAIGFPDSLITARFLSGSGMSLTGAGKSCIM